MGPLLGMRGKIGSHNVIMWKLSHSKLSCNSARMTVYQAIFVPHVESITLDIVIIRSSPSGGKFFLLL